MARSERPPVDIRRIRYFVAVCDCGGLTKAAPVIGIAQPALTRQIKLLEQEIGVELLSRNGRGALPTAAGYFLLAEARKHLDGLDLLVDRMQLEFGEGPAKVNLGICPTIAPLFQDYIDGPIRHGSGSVELNVIEAYSGDLRNLMAAGHLDLALTYAVPGASGVRSTDLLSEKLVLASQNVPAKSMVRLNDLTDMQLIFPSRIHQLRRIIDTVCSERDVALSPALELDSLAAVKAMVGSNLGHYSTILPFHSVVDDTASGRYSMRMIDDPGMVRTIALLQRNENERRIPDGLADAIVSRAADIKKTMEAVF